jgi:hypothetical protein
LNFAEDFHLLPDERRNCANQAAGGPREGGRKRGATGATAWIRCDSVLAVGVCATVSAVRAGASPAPHIAAQARQSERIGRGKGAAGAALPAGAQVSPAGLAVNAGTAKPDNIACNATA